MGFAHPRGAQQQDVAAFGQEAAGGQFVKEGPVDRGLEAEVKLGQTFQVRAIAEPQAGVDDAPFAGGQFGFQQFAQKVEVAPGLGGGLLRDLVQQGDGGGVAEALQAFLGQVFVAGGAHC